MLLLKQMAILFVIMIIGYILRKIKMINDAGSKVLSAIVVNVANPCLILSASINKESTIKGAELGKTALLALGVFAFLIVISLFLPTLIRARVQNRSVYRVMTIFSNIGFMGFPVISAVYGSDALLYASIFLIPYNVLIYTYGIAALHDEDELKKTDAKDTVTDKSAYEDSADVKTRDKKEGKKKLPISKILNVGVIACVLTIIIYLTGVKVPTVIEEITASLSNLTAPLSMIVIGSSLGKISLKSLFTDLRLLLFSAIKLIVIPVIGMFIVSFLGLDPKLNGVMLIMLATPVGSMTAMLAEQYGGNVDLASRGVALTTIFSVATIPFVSWIVSFIM
ncbi:MAG: AEC family transporter [Lachnospiraceae bacterium]|nr:AEC family transporter [Lachnospiraceae bacterium]